MRYVYGAGRGEYVATTEVDIDYHDMHRVREHGQDWFTCGKCGAQWSIEDSNIGEVVEQVTDGDGYCEEFCTGYDSEVGK